MSAEQEQFEFPDDYLANLTKEACDDKEKLRRARAILSERGYFPERPDAETLRRLDAVLRPD